MQSTIPMLSIVFMAISALIGIAIPVVLYIIFRKKNKANHLPFWVGCVTFVLFALVLEQLMYSFLMKTPILADGLQQYLADTASSADSSRACLKNRDAILRSRRFFARSAATTQTG